MGVLNVITPDGTGEAAVYSYIRRHTRGGKVSRAFEQVRREFEPDQPAKSSTRDGDVGGCGDQARRAWCSR